MIEGYEERIRRGEADAVYEVSHFFSGDGPVPQSLRRVTGKLEALGIPYAVAGGMALNAHGYLRATVDVDILVTQEGLDKIHKFLEGLGYLPPFKGSKQLRDTESGVKVEFLVAGQYPGDGKPKPVVFQDPAKVGVVIRGVRYVNLETLLEMKLASGMSNSTRMKDLSDVQEVIKQLELPKAFSDRLNPYVREEYLRIWRATHPEG